MGSAGSLGAGFAFDEGWSPWRTSWARLASNWPSQRAIDDRRDCVADEVGEGAHLGHEAVDAEEEGDAGDGDGAEGGEGGGEGDEATSGDGGGAFGVEHEDEQDEDLLAEREVGVGGLRDEEGGDGEIDGGAVEIEGVAGGDDESGDGAGAAEELHLAQEAGERGSEEEVPRTISSSSRR